MLRLETLGVLRLAGAQGELLKGRRMELVLLTYLARHSPRRVPRDELAALLWEDRNEARARGSLRQALLQLKRIVGDGLETTPDAARLDPGVVELDVAEFAAEATAGRLVAAAERWQGDFLAGTEAIGGETYRQWLESEREALRRRFGALLERLVGQAELENDPAAARRWAERWSSALPYDERALHRLCLVLREQGETSAALAAHAAFVSRIRTELELEPAAEILQLGVELAAADRSAPALLQSAALLAPELVGRGPALATLRAAWSEARGGAAGAVLVEGEQGLGKTRLCEELLQEVRAASQSAIVLYTRGLASDRQAPWATLRRLLEPLGRAPGAGAAPPHALAEVAELVPELRERFGNLPMPSGRPGQLEPALVEVLRESAVDTPLLLLIDEVTHADALSRALLVTLVRAALPGVLIVLADRTEELEAQDELRELGKLAGRLKLRPLAPLQVENLLDSMLTLPPDQRRALADRISVEGEGNPFFTVELLSGLADTQLLVLDPGGSWSLAEGLARGPLPIPSTVRESVRDRLQRLSEPARRVVLAAAVLGRQIDPALLEAVAGGTPAEFSVALDELLSRRLLREASEPGGGYLFGHELVRRVAYEMLSPAARAALHRAAAAALERRPREAVARRDLEYHRRRGPLPARRRSWPRLAAGALLAGAAGLGLWSVLLRAGTPPVRPVSGGPPRLLVLAFSNETGDPSLNSLGRIAADWLSQGIARTGVVRVVPPGFDSAGGENAGARLTRVRALAAGAEADLVIWGSYYWSGDSLQLQADLADLHRSEPLLALGTVRTGVHSPMPAIELLRQKTLAVLASQLDPRLAAAAAVQSRPPSYEAYQQFAEGLDYWYRRQGGNALPHLMRAYAIDTSYTLPLLYAIGIHFGEGRPTVADSLVLVLLPRRGELAPYDRAVLDMYAADDLIGGYNAARTAAEIAPGSPIAASNLPDFALSLNRPREALTYLLRIDPDSGEASRLPAYWAQLSAALHLLGEYSRQLEVGKQVRRRFPDDDRSYFYQTRALAALGRLDELDAVLNESLQLHTNPLWGPPAATLHILAFDELTAHGHPEHARVVVERALAFFQKAPASLQALPRYRFDKARLLAQIGRLDEARRLLEELLRSGGAIGANESILRGEIGIVAALQGDLRAVEQQDHWLAGYAAAHLNGMHTEYRAKFAALLGKREEAMRLLQQASGEGYGFGLARHQAFQYRSLRGYRPFDEFMRPKR